jgi:hypothetical protein
MLLNPRPDLIKRMQLAPAATVEPMMQGVLVVPTLVPYSSGAVQA